MKRRQAWIAWSITTLIILQTLSAGAAQALQQQPAAGDVRATQGDAAGQATLRVLASSADHLILELTVPGFGTEEVELEGHRFLALSAKGLDTATVPGQPQLPLKQVLVGLPPSGGWSIRVLDAESQVVALPYAVAPARTAVKPSPGSGSSLASSPPDRMWDEAVYSTDAAFPASLAAGGQSAVLRDLRVARLSLHPFLYNPVRGQVEHVRRLVVEVSFERPEAGTFLAPDAWDAILQQSVLNYGAARAWRAARASTLHATTHTPANMPGSFKVEIDADGMYELTYGALDLAGFPVATVDPGNLQLWVGGQEVAIWEDGNGDDTFEEHERLVFYGQAAQGRYTEVNVYWLFDGGAPGSRMAGRDAAPVHGYTVASSYWKTVHHEGNHVYDSVFAEADGDHWYWTKLDFLQTECPAAAQEFTFDLPHLLPAVHTATVSISLQGTTFGPHHLTAWINGQFGGDLFWSDLDRLEQELSFTSAWLAEGSNVLRLENGDCPSIPPAPPPNGMLFNSFDAGFQASHMADGALLAFRGEAGPAKYDLQGFSIADPLLFDVSDSGLPELLTGAQTGSGHLLFEDDTDGPHDYFALARTALRAPRAIHADTPSDLASASNEADYVLIGHGPFLAAAQPLVDLRNAQGLGALSIDVQDVYDEFNFGVLSPEAIRAFLGHASAAWQVSPTYVVLLGDGTLDYLDHLGNGWHNFVPVYLAAVEPALGGAAISETASDSQLACVAGNDNLPDLLLGRLPVSSVAETQAVVAKVVQYESSPVSGWWNRRALFVADNEDIGGDFPDRSDALYARYEWDGFSPRRVYLTVEADESHEYDPRDAGDWESARTAIHGGIRSGQLLVTYFGHSSWSQWAVSEWWDPGWEPPNRLLHRDEVPGLQNGGRLPVVLDMTCFTAAFQRYEYASLDERLVVEPLGGAVAAWGPTGSGYIDGHYSLAQGFLDVVLGDDADKTLGSATAAGRNELFAQDEFFHHMIDSLALLGDPAMTLNVEFTEADHHIYLPFVARRD
jgi:hypothetical protein